MAYLACSSRLSHDGDDVETDVETDAVPFDIGIGCEGERSHFLWCDGLVGIGELLVLPCLHLGDDKHAVVYRNDVQVAVAVVPVTVENGISQLAELACRHVLSPSAQFVMVCHASFLCREELIRYLCRLCCRFVWSPGCASTLVISSNLLLLPRSATLLFTVQS